MRTRIAISALLLCLFFSSHAQTNGDLFNQKYFRIGPSFPTKGYFGRSNWDNSLRLGGVIETGKIFILNSIPLAERLRLGINPDWVELKYLHFKTDIQNTTINEGTISLSSKIGASISYGITKEFIIDAYTKAYLPWLALTYRSNGGASTNDVLMYGGYLGLGYSIGINLRYNVLMFGIDFSKVNMKMEDADIGGNYLGDESDLTSKKTPMPAINLTFGVSF